MHLTDSDAAAALLDLTEDVEANLLVIGVRRRSAVGKLLMGSTAQRLILEARCPVLAVKS
ncbi:universal stress protein [Nocardiopsis eucommiae]|uniref:Universal stress protein n=1 Tax=Nocardiopsis eucommiae TaxID=2831970 RepID=A0A975LBN1_9ACTN|nr:universal stress protein [Nocardiopsis eucommiae]